MRKASYLGTFVVVLVTLILNILATTRTDWIIYKSPKFAGTSYTTYYGLNKLCELRMVDIPDGGTWSSSTCRPFPTRKLDCPDGGSAGVSPRFCEAWITAGYASELSIGFAAVSLVAILIGVSTGSRRRRVWKAAAILIGLHAALQVLCFTIITHLYQSESYPTFGQARPGAAYVSNTVSWIIGVLITFAVITTGISAERGHRWAAGNRAYQSIND